VEVLSYYSESYGFSFQLLNFDLIALRSFNKIAAFLALLGSLIPLKATHIVGGEMNYRYLGNDEYLIDLSVFMDCINGDPGAIGEDATAWLSVFDGSTNNMLQGYPILVARNGPNRITKVNYNCISTTPNACVDHYWYQTTLYLPPRAGGYVVSFQRCCRNGTISNIVNPGGTGANYWTRIPDANEMPDKKPNTSAVFKELPPNFLCTNTILKFDHSAYDADGDSLVYDLFTPFLGASRTNPRPDNNQRGQLAEPPFYNIQFANGYNFETPIDGDPPLTIDPETGFIFLVPTVEGQFVVGIRVREYRNGVLISETKRDYQFNVSECQVDMVAAYYVPKFICGYTHRFDNKSTGAERYHWDFGVFGTNKDTSANAFPYYTFPAAGRYTVKLITYKDNCIDSFVQEVTVLDPQKPKLPQDTLICVGRTATYTSDIVAESYLWNTGARTRTLTVNKQGLYWLEVGIKTCRWRDSVYVKVDADKVKGFGDTVYCTYDTFDRWLTSSRGFYNYRWNTGAKLDQIKVDQKGDYVISASTINNCPSSDTVFVEHYPPVIVTISDSIVCEFSTVAFDAKNSDAKINWSTGDQGQYFYTKKPDTYHVLVTRGKCFDRDTFSLYNYPLEFALGDDLRFCSAIDTILTVDAVRFRSVVWNGEVTSPSYRLRKPGKLIVNVINSYGCPESDSIYVSLFPNPSLNLGNDTVVCTAIDPVLDATADMITYQWQDNKSERFYIVKEPGLYWVEIKDREGCLSRDTVFIDKNPNILPSLVYMPNAFTPDGNALNDFYPDNKYPAIGALYNVKLYNRWGEKLVDYDSPSLNWDGFIGGKPAPEGVYVYLITWIGCDNVRRTMHGDFHLLR
jgi:gliding motility-associated-like protein